MQIIIDNMGLYFGIEYVYREKRYVSRDIYGTTVIETPIGTESLHVLSASLGEHIIFDSGIYMDCYGGLGFDGWSATGSASDVVYFVPSFKLGCDIGFRF